MALLRTQVQDSLDNMKALGLTAVKVDGKGRTMDVDLALEPEFATDKDQVKVVPCRECRRPMVVTTFFTPEKALCRPCSGEAEDTASVTAVTPGETEPRKAMELADCLINQQFATAICPICVEPMELKQVFHNDNYGPGHWEQSSKGPVWVQDAKGETAMHQCNRCRLTLTMATTAVHTFRRINEPREGRHVNGWAELLGTREEKAA